MSEQPETARKDKNGATEGKRLNLLSDYFRDAGSKLRAEQNRFTIYLVGAAIIGTAVLLPLGAVFLAPNYRLVTLVPSGIILLIALRNHRPTGDSDICASGLPSELRPCKQLTACWQVRSDAEPDIKASILASHQELFVAGACLNTLKRTFADPQVVKHVIETLTYNVNYKITALVIGNLEDYGSVEEGRRALADNLRSGRRVLQRFLSEVRSRLPGTVSQPNVEIRAYNPGVLPRHFILKADKDIYIGSYLCHESGSYSHLFRLKDRQEDGTLHRVFCREIKYLTTNSQRIDIEEEIHHAV